MRKAIIIPGFLALAACGGGGGTAVNPQFEAQRAQIASLCSEYDCNTILPESYTDFSAVEVLDTPLTYSGFAAYRTRLPSGGVPNANEILALPLTTSEIELTANFADSNRPVTGSLTNFQSSSPDVKYTGSLDIVTGRVGNAVVDGTTVTGKAGIDGATLSGTLNVSSSTRNEDILYTGSFDAVFVGSDARAVIGEGSISGSGETAYFAFIGDRP